MFDNNNDGMYLTVNTNQSLNMLVDADVPIEQYSAQAKYNKKTQIANRLIFFHRNCDFFYIVRNGKNDVFEIFLFCAHNGGG